MAIDLSDLPKIRYTVVINGVEISGEALIDILNMVTKPRDMWYRFELKDGQIVVYSRVNADRASAAG